MAQKMLKGCLVLLEKELTLHLGLDMDDHLDLKYDKERSL